MNINESDSILITMMFFASFVLFYCHLLSKLLGRNPNKTGDVEMDKMIEMIQKKDKK